MEVKLWKTINLKTMLAQAIPRNQNRPIHLNLLISCLPQVGGCSLSGSEIAQLLNLSTGIILLGIGTITLLVQVARKYLNLRIELFNVVIGLLFMIGGFWENYKPESTLIPVFLIVVGTGLLLSFIRHLMIK